jgi:F-type H+-transporting ATPase subunit alpha
MNTASLYICGRAAFIELRSIYDLSGVSQTNATSLHNMAAQKTTNFIQKKLRERQTALNGTIYRLGDGIANIFGLDDVKAGELLFFPTDQSFGIAFNLEKYGVGAILLGDGASLKEGSRVESTGRLADIKVNASYLGTVVDGFGKILLQSNHPLDFFQKDQEIGTQFFEAPAPSIIRRFPVNEAMQTGVLAIDTLIPIGRGQRELLIGDRQIGKTQIALDAILNLSSQYDREVERFQNKERTDQPKPTICIYVAIGQKASSVAEIQKKLGSAMKQTIIVSATAGSAASMQFLAPFTGTAIAETFMVDQGLDVLIVYDDLTRHAQAYREMSLLLRRPPGREAYPGDIFYVHARLLERSSKLENSGSLTALPIIETLAGDISAYIPTNVISITDGQVFFSQQLFNRGNRPAVDVGLSVSRVGSAAQPKKISKLVSNLKLILAQFRELQVFTQFSSDIDAEAQSQLDNGNRLTQIFIQPPSKPYAECIQFALVHAFNTVFQKISVENIEASITQLVDALISIQSQNLSDEESKLGMDFIKKYESNQSIEDVKGSLDAYLAEWMRKVV